MATKTRYWPHALAALGILIFGLLLWKGPWWFDGAHLRRTNLQPADGVVITGFRTVLVAVGVAASAAVGLLYTHRSHQTARELLDHTREKDREQAELTREGQVTDRYVEAIKLLAAKDEGRRGSGLMERLGGIYALERIMRDSAKDHDTVVQVLVAFVRQQVPRADEEEEARRNSDDLAPVKSDVQAALKVLGRRPDRQDDYLLDLSYLDLCSYDLAGAQLSGANLCDTLLAFADLRKANLRGAELGGAGLYCAKTEATDLREADLSGERQPARMSVEQFLAARTGLGTIVPKNLGDDPRVQELMKQSFRYRGK
ncbi:pentapeptide repeat-containing protein [Streptomyces anulatus]|uniref:pentapeptide repeat-containing protein n=1 Tax=Streptomyces anulatus TaxID=1892 RepID=UPI002F912CE9|nr:pentapeptide repeat-containing protein [Streptomyces anulatus]